MLFKKSSEKCPCSERDEHTKEQWSLLFFPFVISAKRRSENVQYVANVSDEPSPSSLQRMTNTSPQRKC